MDARVGKAFVSTLSPTPRPAPLTLETCPDFLDRHKAPALLEGAATDRAARTIQEHGDARMTDGQGSDDFVDLFQDDHISSTVRDDVLERVPMT